MPRSLPPPPAPFLPPSLSLGASFFLTLALSDRNCLYMGEFTS
eukprot:CAMPEP_0168474022 /NCGR_PEP_ID=MMETSP0228-20121227/60626_1 /TAXON_ID=133427 /ORGANISM="Protoceratium reticulatum, Strain CCCM 535 (=CCMP 1889)" /LENGTH=42 /DNA_ID= /DNA_START= /DNA_END= /DNA_ORIENTATION=